MPSSAHPRLREGRYAIAFGSSTCDRPHTSTWPDYGRARQASNAARHAIARSRHEIAGMPMHQPQHRCGDSDLVATGRKRRLPIETVRARYVTRADGNGSDGRVSLMSTVVLCDARRDPTVADFARRSGLRDRRRWPDRFETRDAPKVIARWPRQTDLNAASDASVTQPQMSMIDGADPTAIVSRRATAVADWTACSLIRIGGCEQSAFVAECPA